MLESHKSTLPALTGVAIVIRLLLSSLSERLDWSGSVSHEVKQLHKCESGTGRQKLYMLTIAFRRALQFEPNPMNDDH
jgi:hypothetical protein